MNKAEKLYTLGQSIWYDNIQRRLLENGELEGMIKRHEIFGVTSNPSIFQNAIAKTNDYDADLKPMAWSGWTEEQIFWELAVEDIRKAADLFKSVYEETSERDGYVSLEVDPRLAHDAAKTFLEAQRLWQKVNRENLMIKIPATKEGVLAVRQAIAAGINVNVTLIFSLQRYEEVIDAYMAGLEDRLAQGKQVENIASVASFFVSRVDTKVDPLLTEAKAGNLLGRAAISNVKLAYELFQKHFTSARFEKLANAGAKLQRPLWASTSTKNPAYSDVIYVEELIGPDTVNTIPPQTLVAFLDHGKADTTLTKEVELARQDIVAIEARGIDMSRVTQELEDEGVEAFAVAFKSLLEAIKDKAAKVVTELGPIKEIVAAQVTDLEKTETTKRLFEVDPTLWTDDPTGHLEIKKRCDWLNAPWNKAGIVEKCAELQKYCRDNGFEKAVLLGMGGSSLAPEVLRLVNGFSALDLHVLDSTDPGQVKEVREQIDIEKTLFIVSSKSGGTAEVNAFLDYFWGEVHVVLGKKAGGHFIAITDPGTNLETTAGERGFWRVFHGDPMVGGRNSALTAFGLVPAALIGMSVEKLLKNAITTAEKCLPEVPMGANPGAVLGAILGAAWTHGRDKLTILTDPDWDSFGNWMEQLIAESSGKQGKGIIPIVNEPEMEAGKYQNDRLFVYLNSQNGRAAFVEALRKAGQPVIDIAVKDGYDLGGQFYLWEVATAIACSIMGVNSFDQPDVQDNKTRTVKKIAEFKESGKLVESEPVVSLPYVSVFGDKATIDADETSAREIILGYLKKVCKKGDYIAINAYVPRNQVNFDTLSNLRQSILETTNAATTLGFGPRFLHSTGQLHKGGPDASVFIQITTDNPADIEIPTEGMTFGILEKAQYLGDFEALQGRGRRLIRIHLKQADHQKLLK